MIKLITQFTLILLVIPFVSKSQMISNGSFSNYCGPEFNSTYEDFNFDTNGSLYCMGNWRASHGRPFVYNHGYISLGGNPYGGFNTAVNGKGSGFFTSANFIAGKTYRIKFKAALNTAANSITQSDLSLYVYAANGINPINTSFNSPARQVAPSISSKQNVITINPVIGNTTFVQDYSFLFTPNSNYTQLWFYTKKTHPLNGGGGSIDDVIVYEETCCQPSITYTDANIPAFTTTDGYIRATNTAIVTDGRDVHFQAEDEIILSPSFKVEAGATFEAVIKSCCEATTRVSINKTRNLCESILTAEMNCFGSGNYNYNWSNSSGTTLGTSSILNVSSSNSQEIFCTVTDNVSGQSYTKSVMVEGHTLFRGPLSYDPAPNFFSPNGDGINDMWTITDGGVTSMVYNAYSYNLKFYNRWGTLIYTKSNSVDNYPGFQSEEIFFDGGSLSDGTYFYSLELWSCDQYEMLRGQTNILRGQSDYSASSDVLMELEEFSFESNQLLSIYPNPTSSGKFNIEMEAFGINKTIKVLNVYGKLITQFVTTYNHTSIDLSSYAKGMYLVKISDGHTEKTQKVIFE